MKYWRNRRFPRWRKIKALSAFQHESISSPHRTATHQDALCRKRNSRPAGHVHRRSRPVHSSQAWIGAPQC